MLGDGEPPSIYNARKPTKSRSKIRRLPGTWSPNRKYDAETIRRIKAMMRCGWTNQEIRNAGYVGSPQWMWAMRTGRIWKHVELQDNDYDFLRAKINDEQY